MALRLLHLTEGMILLAVCIIASLYPVWEATAVFLLATSLGIWADRLWGDPSALPHPIVGYGKAIAWMEKRLNRGRYRKAKGGFTAVFLVFAVWGLTATGFYLLRGNPWLCLFPAVVILFFMLSGETLVREVRNVFIAVDRSLEEGRRQVGRIVGRDTTRLDTQEIRLAALETLAENLSDGVIAPMFWYAVGAVIGLFWLPGGEGLWMGLPFICAYKMINTLDSMIGYRNQRYRDFGYVAAHLDDIANYLPARLTAFLMLAVAGRPGLIPFVRRFGRAHLSPNSGYPESALAGILNCRFGGPHDYFGEEVYKPYIGTNGREILPEDVIIAIRINRLAEGMMWISVQTIAIGSMLIAFFL